MDDPAVLVALIGGGFGLAGIVVGGIFSWFGSKRTKPDANSQPADVAVLEAALKSVLRDLASEQRRAERLERRAVRCEAREAARDE